MNCRKAISGVWIVYDSEEWAKIMDEIDGAETESIQDALDKID